MTTDEILSGLPLWATLPNTSQDSAGKIPQWDGAKWVAVDLGGFDETADYGPSGEWTVTGLWTFAGATPTFNNTINAISGVALGYSTPPAGTANYTTMYASSTGLLSWRNGTGFTRTFDAASITANRTWSLPDANTTLAGLSIAQTFTAAQSINLANSSALTDFTINPTVKTSGNLFAFSVNGSSRGTLSNTGVLTVASHVNAGGDIVTSSATAQLKINDTKLGRGGADGVFVMMNNAENGFGRLCFGGITSAYSAIKSNGTNIDFVLANDAGGWASIRAGSIQAAGVVRLAASTATVASLNIPAGAAMTSHADGNIWLETDGTLYIRIAGVSKRFTLS
jgi:hypothetical protein